MKILLFLIAAATASLLVISCQDSASRSNEQENNGDLELRLMSWNIWHGGRKDGKEMGPQRVSEIILSSKADILAMQETYGSGEKISKSLGFHLHTRGANLSIHSRYPIIEDISVYKEFNCVGGLIELPNQQKIAFYNIWLPYDNDIWKTGGRSGLSTEEWQDACRASASALEEIHRAIRKRLADPKYKGIAVVIAGDFNSMSHLDYCAEAKSQYGRVVDWETSHVLVDEGYRDSYRECNPTIHREVDATWSPKFPKQEQDRIDFIYYKSNAWRAVSSRVIREHDVKFPSDHAAVLSVLEFKESEKSE